MIDFITLSNYTSPEISEVRGKEWVSYGDDNNYFGYLLDRYRGSPTNHAIINGVSESIIGNGLLAENAHRYPEQYLEMNRLFKDEDLRRWAFDLKCYGFYVQVVIMDEALDKIVEMQYTPVQNWRSGVADAEGIIHEMYYSDNWQEYRKKQYEPESYDLYNPNIKRPISILVVKPYRSGSFYYPSVDYQGALQYAHIEEEIANFHLNNIRNGLAPAMLVNFNTGDPGEEKRKMMERLIQNKWGGTSNAGKFILAFNDSKEDAATIEAVEQPDLDKQYQFLSEEATKKIMVGHRITSPLFFGIRDSAGLGSNADEIKNAWLLYERTVLKSYRTLMSNNIHYVLKQNKSFLETSFESNTPIEFEMSKNYLDDFISMGEVVDLDKWELVDEGEVDYELEMASTGTARPDAKSEQDEEIDDKIYKVRYKYTGDTPQREFCSKMMSSGKVYRKEDIEMMGDKPVNAGWGPKGADTYSIWLYKGGGNCHHKWMRQTFVSKEGKGVTPSNPLAETISTNKAEKAGYRVRNPKEVAMMPKDLPNAGFLN